MSTAASMVAVNERPDPALLLSVSALARRRGRDKALVSRQVAKLVGAGKLTTYPGERSEKLVNFVEFERALGENADLVKEQAAETARLFRGDEAAEPPQATQPGTLSAQQREKLLYETELRKLDLAERRRQVIPIALLTDVLREVADSAVSILERLPLRAGEITAAVAKDGEAGARAVLKAAVFDMRTNIAAAWDKIEQAGLAEEANGPITVEVPDEAA